MTGQYLTFTLQRAVYAVPVSFVQEVLEYTAPDPLPCAQDYIEGLVSSRGRGLQVINLCKRLGLEAFPATKETRIIVIELNPPHGGSDLPMAFAAVADSVKEVIEISPNELESAPKFGNSIASEYIAGVAGKGSEFIVVLDLSRIFQGEAKAPSAS